MHYQGKSFSGQSPQTITKYLQKSIAFTHGQIIEDLCRPLQALGISGFFYMRIYPDGTFIDFLSRNVAPWSMHYFSHFFSEKYDPALVQQHMMEQRSHVFWDFYPENIIWQEGREFGFCRGLSINQISSEYNEIFSFFSSSTSNISTTLYLEYPLILNQFIADFLDRTELLIKQATKERWDIPQSYQLSKEVKGAEGRKEKIRHFLSQLSTQGLCLHNKSQKCILTLRETQTLHRLTQGYSAKEVARQLKISPRTAEKHLDNIKIKLGCNKTTKLIDIAIQQGIDEIAPHLAGK